jgi:hypothetical protein
MTVRRKKPVEFDPFDVVGPWLNDLVGSMKDADGGPYLPTVEQVRESVEAVRFAHDNLRP